MLVLWNKIGITAAMLTITGMKICVREFKRIKKQ